MLWSLACWVAYRVRRILGQSVIDRSSLKGIDITAEYELFYGFSGGLRPVAPTPSGVRASVGRPVAARELLPEASATKVPRPGWPVISSLPCRRVRYGPSPVRIGGRSTVRGNPVRFA
ncbi:hypothetical protein GCM10010169_29210 [Micromonospora fulviviridis]|nr:hypothetical protein GCM10010169_29210 [Micromonospora fulviviridis]